MKKHLHDLDEEGVTRYQLVFKKTKPVPSSFLQQIGSWRSLLHSLEWIGQDPNRYRGVGFGNISRRMREQIFVISGTQTGRLSDLSPQHYAKVLLCQSEKNFVSASGPIHPSSESLTHAVIYRKDPTCQVVMHVHSSLLWTNARRLGLSFTSSTVPYGTPQMAREVERLFKKKAFRKSKIFAMGGHRDGVISFGRTADEAGIRLIHAALRCLQKR